MTQTIRLTDLAQRIDTVELSVGTLEILPLGAGDLAHIFVKYPSAADFLSGKVELSTIKSLAQFAPLLVPEIIAISGGMPGPAGAAIARRMTAEDQLRAIDKILAITFPGGAQSFFALLAEFAPAPQAAQEQVEHPDVVEDIETLMKL